MKRLFFNRALRVLLVTNAMILISAAMLGPIYALFVEKIGGSLLDASLTSAIFAFAAGLTTLSAGRYIDKIKRPHFIVIFGYLVMGLSFILYMFVNTIWALFSVQILIGFAEAISYPAFDAVYSKHLTRGKIGTEWGAWESVNFFSAAIGATIGGFIATIFGFNGLFTIMAGLCFLSAIYMLYFTKNCL